MDNATNVFRWVLLFAVIEAAAFYVAVVVS